MMEGKGRILVIDDEFSIREIVRLVLEKQGYHVEVAGDGQEAVEAFRDQAPDLVISDVAMPRGDGFNVAILIRSHEASAGKRTPILLMSAFYEEEANRDNTARCGADGFLPKPFTHAQLVEAVERLLAGRAGGASP
jgi:two-component system response regulator MprA